MIKKNHAAPYGDIIKDCPEYKGFRLLQSEIKNGFYKDVLDSILDLFDYVDMLKEFSPVFMRFDFPAKSTEENILRFFDRTKKLHQRNGKRFFYMYTREFEQINKHEHYHAFCIVNRRDYTSALNVEKMIQRSWEPEITRNEYLNGLIEENEKNIWFTRVDKKEQFKPICERSSRRYNFYSLSTDSRSNPEDRARAFEAASYMAKVTQVPGHNPAEPRKRRRGRSTLPKITMAEIRPGYDLEKAKRFLKAPGPRAPSKTKPSNQ